MSEVPGSYPQLRDVLQQRLPGLAPGQRRIAELLLTDPEGCAFRTVTEMAGAAAVHESSVVRFATGLGLRGYPALAQLCRAHLAEQAQLVGRFDQAGTGSGSLLPEVVRHDRSNLERTFAELDPATWDAVIDLLATAPAVHIIGLRKCHTIAYLLRYLLHLVRDRVYQLTPDAGLLIDQLRDLSPGDTLVATAIHRYTEDTVRTLEYAHKRGLSTVALTDNPASPLAAVADRVCYVQTGGVTLLRSMTAFTSLVQAMATEVALRLGTSSRSELRLDEELLAEFAVYRAGPALIHPPEDT